MALPSAAPPPSRPVLSRLGVPLALILLAALLFFPYLFLGKSLVPLDLLPGFQPWSAHARELWSEAQPPPHNPLLDSIQQYYPRRVLFSQSVQSGSVPLWNPYVYGGSSFAGSQQGAVLYPPAWLLSLLPAAAQFGWSAALHLGIALLGGFAFFRQLGLRQAAATTGALAWGLNGFVLVWLAYPNVTQWTLCWLPLALFLWERARQRNSFRALAGCALVLAVNVLGGHGQSSLYVLLAWGGWALLRTLAQPFPSRKPLAGIGLWVALPSALALVMALGQLLPALDYLPRTDRGARVPWEAVVKAGMPPMQLLTMLLPRLFGDGTLATAHQFWMPSGDKQGLAFIERSFYPGVSVLALAGGAWSYLRVAGMQRQLLAYGGLLAVLSVLWAMGTPAYWPLWAAVPGFGNFTAIARILCLAGWGLACLAALGVHALGEDDDARRGAGFRGIAVSGGLVLVATLLAHFIYGGADPLQIGAAVARYGQPPLDAQAGADLLKAVLCLLMPVGLGALAVWGKPTSPWPRAALLGAACVVAADLAGFGIPYNPHADTALLSVRPAELTELARATDAVRRGEAQPFRFLSAGPKGQETAVNRRLPANLPAAMDLPDVGGSDSFVPLRYREWETATGQAAGGSAWAKPGSANLRSAGVAQYLLSEGTDTSALENGGAPLLYRDPKALPYARLHGFAQAMGKSGVLGNLAVPQRAPTVALLEGEGAQTVEGPAMVVPFTVRRLSPNRLAVEGDAPFPGLLVVCEGYDPGWRATVDGKPAKLYPADHLLIGTPLPPGKHRVELSYHPSSWRAGLFGTLAGLAMAAALVVASRRRNPAEN